MLQIKNICKKYKTGDLIQDALNDVTLNFRDNEFVAILGPSGSGKTTLLNVVGGLDRYDSGDLIINGISTKDYSDRDWDSYRNHSVGFVFQSYNLIPHQSILSNVELALTISGVSKDERRARAKTVLNKVGLGEQTHKKPNQLSGGQMQRVAIARALINDPDILLADEPTGALDSATSVQVMELLKEVAEDKLVIMVTHNPELAEGYATRTVKLRDAKVKSDSNPYIMEDEVIPAAKKKNMGKASMSLLTSLSLSFNNLRTKKGRTLLTAFAGSIGIIGIALILALSTGVNDYIDDIQKDTMTSYPITIDSETVDISSLMGQGSQMGGMGPNSDSEDINHDLDAVYSNDDELEMASTMTNSITENNLTEFKNYLDDPDSDIQDYLGENGVIYSYDVAFDVYSYDPNQTLVNADGSTLTDDETSSNDSSSGTASGMSGDMTSAMNGDMTSDINSGMASMMTSDTSDNSPSENFSEILPGQGDTTISAVVTDSYDCIYGEWPENYNEVVLVLDENNEISLTALYELGFLPSEEYSGLMNEAQNGDYIKSDPDQLNYEDITNHSLYLISSCDYYVQNADGTFANMSGDADKLNELLNTDAVELKITGIIRPAEDAANADISGPIGYTTKLTDYLIDRADTSTVVNAQRDNPDTNILTNSAFDANGNESKAADAYEDNMTAFGYVSLDAPSSISIYADNFEDKEAISASIEDYNSTVDEENQITYTDYVALLMSSITTIINVITYVLIAFVAVSLIVSSIMIGIITYISVLERTKEIGILRAIGASKGNISQVFNAETFIIGLCSGLLGIGISSLLLIPGNAVIHALIGSTAVNASIPVSSAIILIVLSVILTLIGGFIPAKGAAKKDPVAALRTE